MQGLGLGPQAQHAGGATVSRIPARKASGAWLLSLGRGAKEQQQHPRLGQPAGTLGASRGPVQPAPATHLGAIAPLPGAGAEGVPHPLPLPSRTRLPILQPLGQQALTQPCQQGPPVGGIGAEGQLQLQTGLIGTLGLGAELELERSLAQQAQLGRTQAIAFLKRLAHEATAQEPIDEGGQPPPLQEQ